MKNRTGIKIEKYINEKGLSKKEISSKCGMTEKELEEVTTGKIKLDMVTYFKICEALGVSINYFAE